MHDTLLYINKILLKFSQPLIFCNMGLYFHEIRNSLGSTALGLYTTEYIRIKIAFMAQCAVGLLEWGIIFHFRNELSLTYNLCCAKTVKNAQTTQGME